METKRDGGPGRQGNRRQFTDDGGLGVLGVLGFSTRSCSIAFIAFIDECPITAGTVRV
jgi:hypothetical protein